MSARQMLCLASVLCVVQPVAAQEYPSRPVRVIVPFAPGRGDRYRNAPRRAEAL
jgi:tripartite-type tricarboxylate transporter receptor subunit TctC